jgi:hypothetical protein
MAEDYSGGKGMGGGTKSLHDGLHKKRCPPTDSSMDLTKRSVNEDATRGSTAATPKTLGPRAA